MRCKIYGHNPSRLCELLVPENAAAGAQICASTKTNCRTKWHDMQSVNCMHSALTKSASRWQGCQQMDAAAGAEAAHICPMRMNHFTSGCQIVSDMSSRQISFFTHRGKDKQATVLQHLKLHMIWYHGTTRHDLHNPYHNCRQTRSLYTPSAVTSALPDAVTTASKAGQSSFQ